MYAIYTQRFFKSIRAGAAALSLGGWAMVKTLALKELNYVSWA